MKLKNILACGLAAGMMLLSSCISNSNDDQITTEMIGNCFSYSVNKATGEVKMTNSNSLTVSTNYTQLTIDAGTSKLDVDGIELPAPMFKNLMLVQNTTGWILAEAQAIRPEVKGFAEETVPLFSRARYGSINHLAELNGKYLAGWERVLRLETDTEVFYVSPNSTWSTGNTTVLNMSDESAPLFKSTKPIYVINLDTEKTTATITIYNAVFAPAMEKLGLTIEFRDIPYSVDMYGRLMLRHTDSFFPYHDKNPHKGFPISELNCVWDFFRGIEISFKCEAMGANYRVAADMPFNYGYDSNTSGGNNKN